MKVITVCRSLRFIEEMLQISEKLELEGNSVLLPIYNPNKNKDAFNSDEILMLSKMHKEKIKLSDAVLVVNVDGYIGNSTKDEMEFAKKLNKEIIYYTDLL